MEIATWSVLVAKRVEYHRLNRKNRGTNMTRPALARAAGMSLSTLERRLDYPTISLLTLAEVERLSAALGVSLKKLTRTDGAVP